MSANAEDKSSWHEIFKYLPSLRQMVSCCVCGKIAYRPQGPDHNVCLHFVCEGCKGGKMRLKPSCGWCKDHEAFVENKKVRILINCFKRLCLFISSSALGHEILNASVNGQRNEADKILKILEEVGSFEDDMTLTPPLSKLPNISKRVSKGSNPSFKGSASSRKPDGKRGRPPSLPKSKISAQIRPKSNVANHVKRLKKKALKGNIKKASPGKISFPKKSRFNKSPISNPSNFLISNRPHRERNGNYSIGQLWRETFLEEDQRDVVYPDSGIEVGNSSDQDQNPQILSLEPTQAKDVPESKNNMAEICHKETRSQATHNSKSKHVSVTIENQNDTLNDVDVSSNDRDNVENKPRLMLMISKKAKISHPTARRGMRSSMSSAFIAPKKNKSSDVPLLKHNFKKKGQALVSRQTRNVLQVSPDSAPPLMRFIRESSDSATHNRSMPRLSPIPRV